jgi:hypothetical protein
MTKGLVRSLRRGSQTYQGGIPVGIPITREVSISLTSAQIIGMRAAPVVLIAAQGANKVVIVEEILFKMMRTATAFTGGGAVEFRYTDGSGVKVTGDIAATVVTTGGAGTELNHQGGNLTLTGQPVANAPVVITNATAAFAAGTGTATVYVKYRVVSI